jgi:hypothetical protein
MLSPCVVANQLNLKGVAVRAAHQRLKRVFSDIAPVGHNWVVQRSRHIGVGDSVKVVSFSAPEEGEDFVVNDVRHGLLKAGSCEGDLAVLSKGMLNCRGQFA